MPILEALDYQGMNFDGNAWGYQGGYQQPAAGGYGAPQQQQGAGTWQQQPAAAPGAPMQQQGDTFDLAAYEQQKGPDSTY
jgi:hypothetical protein